MLANVIFIRVVSKLQSRLTNIEARHYFISLLKGKSNAGIRVSHHKKLEKLPFQVNNKLTKKIAILA